MQDVVSQSSVEVEYHVIVHIMFELLSLKNLLIEFCFKSKSHMPM